MHRVLVLIGFLVGLPISAALGAQAGHDSSEWHVFEKQGRYGCRRPDGQVLLQAQYPVPPVLCGKLAIVVVEDSFGVVNQKGEEVVPPACTSYHQWGEGYVLFGRYRSAMINENGLVQGWGLWPMTYHFSEGLAMTERDSPHFYPRYRGPLIGYLNRQYQLQIAPRFAEARDFQEGHAAVRPPGRGWNFVDSAGNLLFPRGFDSLSDFRGGRALVQREGRWGLVDTACRFHAKIRYQELRPVADSLYYFRKGRKRGCLNREGRVAFRTKARLLGQYSNGLAPAQSRKGQWGFLDKEGQWAIPTRYDWAEAFEDGSGLVQKGHTIFYVDTEGHCVKMAEQIDYY